MNAHAMTCCGRVCVNWLTLLPPEIRLPRPRVFPPGPDYYPRARVTTLSLTRVPLLVYPELPRLIPPDISPPRALIPRLLLSLTALPEHS
jgi:hypothetical protein